MNKFTSFLAPLMQAYVFYRKASGYWNEVSYAPNLILGNLVAVFQNITLLYTFFDRPHLVVEFLTC